MQFKIEAVCVSAEKGVQKTAVSRITLLPGHGVEGDAHAGDWHRQVSFLAGEAVDTMRAHGLTLAPGAFGENIVTRGIDWRTVKVGDRVVLGEAELEITQIGKECHTRCAIYYQAGTCIMPDQGVFARVLRGGVVDVETGGDYRIGPGVTG